MKKSTDKIKNFKEMVTDQSKQNEFNNEMVRKTWEYQKNSGLKQAQGKVMNFGIMRQMHLNMHSEVRIWY